MTTLRISLLGELNVTLGADRREVILTPLTQSLFAYLLLGRRWRHPRPLLADIFWADFDEERSQRCLRTALWRLRQALEPDHVAPGTYLISTSTHEVGFNCDSDYWLDVEMFEHGVSDWLRQPLEKLTESDVKHLETAVTLYSGELLKGFYDDWVILERERLSFLYISALTYLMHYYRIHQDHEKGLACGRSILEIDSLREEIHREMMKLYLANGQRTLAIRQYEQCRDLLAVELDIEPMPETRLLYEAIRSAESPARPSGATAAKDNPVHKLEQAMEQFELAQIRLRQAVQQIKQLNNV